MNKILHHLHQRPRQIREKYDDHQKQSGFNPRVKAGLKLVMAMVMAAMMMTMMVMISAVMMLKMVVMIAEKQSGFKGILLQPASIHQPPRHPIYFRPPWICIKQMREQISICFFYPFIQTVTKFKFN